MYCKSRIRPLKNKNSVSLSSIQPYARLRYCSEDFQSVKQKFSTVTFKKEPMIVRRLRVQILDIERDIKSIISLNAKSGKTVSPDDFNIIIVTVK